MPTSVAVLMMMASENKTPCQSLALTGCGGDHLINPLRERVFRRASRSDELFELRHDLEQIAYQAVVGHLEDRRFFVLVDRNDHLGVLHARQVLDGTGDADRDVQLRCDDLAG